MDSHAISGGVRLIGWMCAAIIAALLVIGVASYEVIRHVIQALPAFAAALFAFAGARSSKWMALPVFVVWLVIPILIWLFLLGVSKIANGTYSPVEIAMTIVLALASTIGLIRIAVHPGRVSILGVVFVVAIFAAGEIGVMYVSFQPMFAHDPQGFLGAPAVKN